MTETNQLFNKGKQKKFLVLMFFAVLSIALFTGFENGKINKAPTDYTFVPQGYCTINDKIESIDAFWISKFEVTNSAYSLFLSDLKKQGKDADLKKAAIQDNKWKLISYAEPSASYYSANKKYADYPVVNVTYEGALLYCNWLTSKMDNNKWEYRLPTKSEWIHAAKCGSEPTYSGCGPYLRDAKGQYLVKFYVISEENIHRGPNGFEILNHTNTRFFIAPAKSFRPNEWGMYNMCGNVAEMIQDKGIAMGGSWNDTGYDVRILSEKSYVDPNPMIGFRPVLVQKN